MHLWNWMTEWVSYTLGWWEFLQIRIISLHNLFNSLNRRCCNKSFFLRHIVPDLIESPVVYSCINRLLLPQNHGILYEKILWLLLIWPACSMCIKSSEGHLQEGTFSAKTLWPTSPKLDAVSRPKSFLGPVGFNVFPIWIEMKSAWKTNQAKMRNFWLG